MSWTVPGIIGGIAAGLVGFLPFIVVSRMRPVGAGDSALLRMLGSVLISFLVLSVAILLCKLVAPGHLLSFGMAAAATVIIAAALFSIRSMRR